MTDRIKRALAFYNIDEIFRLLHFLGQIFENRFSIWNVALLITKSPFSEEIITTESFLLEVNPLFHTLFKIDFVEKLVDIERDFCSSNGF